jgi:hypothetical protein
MKIHNKNKKVSRSSIPLSYLIYFLSLFIIIGVIVILNLNFIASQFRNYVYEKGYNAINKNSISESLISIPGNYFDSIKVHNRFDSIYLDIDFKNYSILRDKVTSSLKTGFIFNDGSKVKAQLRTKDKTYNVKLRIKGDNIDHIDTKKWSLRCHISDDKTFYQGMKYFSIQHPKVRGFHGQLITDTLRKKYGLMTPRRFYINLVLNGDDLGIMEVEEHFSKELLEYNQRKESSIFKFDEDDCWRYGENFDWTNSPVDVFQGNKIIPYTSQDFYMKRGFSLLRAFADNKKNASEVFDIKEVATYLALSQFIGIEHGTRWGNIRFYYNPYIDKLQPIGYDDNFNERVEYNKIIASPFFQKLLDDKLIYNEYILKLRMIISDFGNGNFINVIRNVENDVLNSLSKEFFLLERVNKTFFTLRKKIIISEVFNEKSLDYNTKKHVQVFFYNESNSSQIDIINCSNNKITDIKMIGDSLSHITGVLEPFGKKTFDMIKPISFNSKFSYSLDKNKSKVYKVHPILQYKSSHIEDESYLDELITKGIFYLNDNALILKQGDWRFNKNIYIKDYDYFKIDESTNIELDGCGIFSNIPVYIIGSKYKRICFTGTNGGGFLHVSNAFKSSTLNYVDFKSFTSVNSNTHLLTGSVSFYNSDVNISHCSFADNDSEDILNVINSHFDIDHIKVYNTKSDGIDFDYSKGTLRDSNFSYVGKLSGGDSIDLSGSDVIIQDCLFENVGDKSISVGESSVATISNVSIKSSSVGIASKDNSKVFCENIKFDEIKFKEFMVYIKKPQYKSPSLIVDDNCSYDINSSICQRNCVLVINDITLNPSALNVSSLYDTIMYSEKN